ncbi:DUF11 domain-containing protein [Spirosoma rhododendri]|uniref:DUF11 domain-containing protein n=2 Tax=Spirosoma rhododendri TaxID=2728024 RepID=A0A7L5DK71_9BACT|nr:DUF11 domain-containing protein [Spirosoma rhododendri]
MSLPVRCLFLLLFFPLIATAQLQISHPMARLVVQRDGSNNGRIYVSGRIAGAVDRVEAQLTPVTAGQGTATDWQIVQTSPTNNLFIGSVAGTGGWYVLTVRTITGGAETARASVQPVGIGEVFVTAGQSNARGLGSGDNDLGTATDRVNAIDTINHYYPAGTGKQLFSSGDPSPVPVYKALTAGRRVFPMAESSWGWGELGDYIVNRFNVPVAFYVAGWDGSTVENWYKTANGQPTCNRYNCTEDWPNLQPYTNLKNVQNYYLSVAGVRAVLWHQGEAEYDFGNGNSSIQYYYDRLVNVIQRSRQDFNGRNIPWVVARASFDGSVTRQAVIDKQNAVILTQGLSVYPGPYNDTIQNRNAGNTDVHFRNSFRPDVHPRYYLNPNSIPVEMGLSRFARNWNASLDGNFFQNATPITPTQFAATGNVARYVVPGGTISVSFATTGTFNSDNQWQVQLIGSNGYYLATLGSGSSSPITVTLPSTYTSGSYSLRVVSTSPVLPAVPSNSFEINSQGNNADLSLGMDISARTPSVGDVVTVSLTVRNDGPVTSSNIVVRDRLPANLAFVSGTGVTVANGVVTGVISQLNAGNSTSLNFTAQPTADGLYRNAAEIAQTETNDPDSQPNSGTGDGQDDAAQADLRTRGGGSSVYASPNPNQTPLPAVQSNQPTPDPNTADLSLGIAVSNRTPKVNDIVTYTLTIYNRGGATATNVSARAYLPNGQTFASGTNMTATQNGALGTVDSIASGGSVTLQFQARITAAGSGTCTSEITASTPSDPDSTPNNGVDTGEDDTARVDLRAQ